MPAIEISSIDDGGYEGAARELHILGYLIDHTDPRWCDTRDFLADREQRTLRMAENLREEGLELDNRGDRRARRRQASRSGDHTWPKRCSPTQVMRAAERRGDRRHRLADPGVPDRGGAGVRLRKTPTVAEAIAAIHAAGGVAIWAHPFWDVADPEEVLAMIERFRALGIDGVEAFYVTHTREQTELLAARCDQRAAQHRFRRFPRTREPVVLPLHGI